MKQCLKNSAVALIVASILLMSASFTSYADDKKTPLKEYVPDFTVKYGESINLEKPTYIKELEKCRWTYKNNELLLLAENEADSDKKVRVALGYSFDKRYDYAGYEVKWARKISRSNYIEPIYFIASGYQKGIDKKKNKTLFYEKTASYDEKVDRYYFDLDSTTNFYVANYTEDNGVNSLLRVKEVKPVLRPFDIEISQVDGVETVFSGTDKSVYYANENVHLRLKAHYLEKSIEAINIVNPKTGQKQKIAKKFIVHSGAVGSATLGFKIDNEFLTTYNDYIDYKSNSIYGKKGVIKVEPVVRESVNPIPDPNDNSILANGKMVKLKNYNSGMYLIAEQQENGYDMPELNVLQASAKNDSSDVWLVNKKDGKYIFTNIKNNGRLTFGSKNTNSNKPNAVTIFSEFSNKNKFDVTFLKGLKNTVEIKPIDNVNNLALSVKYSSMNSGANVYFNTRYGFDSQKWIVEPYKSNNDDNIDIRPLILEGEYRIKNGKTGNYVFQRNKHVVNHDVNDMEELYLAYTYNPENADVWVVKYDAKGYLTLTQKKTKMNMCIFEEGFANAVYGVNQDFNKFIITKDEDSALFFKIKSKLNKNKFLEATKQTGEQPAKIMLKEKSSSHAQKWIFERVKKNN